MKQELEQKLFDDFPNLYRDHERCFECGDGWYELLRSLSEKLEPLVLQMSDSYRKFFKVGCVKEKFGGLRFDCDYESSFDNFLAQRMEAFIADATTASLKTCEGCGVPATLRAKGWLRVTCDACENERNKRTWHEK